MSEHPPLSLCRLLGGVATSLLFSAFESWVIAEHFRRGYDGEWLSDLFSKSVFVGNGLMAIIAGEAWGCAPTDALAIDPCDGRFSLHSMPCSSLPPLGLVANFLVENRQWGPVAPFDAAIAVLTVGGAIILATWPENYGDERHSGSLKEQFQQAMNAIRRDERVALLGAMQSLFEASAGGPAAAASFGCCCFIQPLILFAAAAIDRCC